MFLFIWEKSVWLSPTQPAVPLCVYSTLFLALVKRIHIHDEVDQSQSLKREKQVDTTLKRSKNVNNSKRMKMLEKEALDVSNIVGFDHENEMAAKEQKIKI